MKNKNSSLYILAAFVLQSAVSLPVFADEARNEEHHANREARRAVDSRTDSAVQNMEGHPIRSELSAKHARHEEHRAVRHATNAAYDR
jgi:Mn-dependent DtxR family transcriptional regulator